MYQANFLIKIHYFMRKVNVIYVQENITNCKITILS